MKNFTTALGKPFAMSLVMICAYCAFMVTAPPSNVATDEPVVVVEPSQSAGVIVVESQPGQPRLEASALSPTDLDAR